MGKDPVLSVQQIEGIQRLAEGLKYGSIELHFQDGKLIQVERNEKFRVNARSK